MFYGQFECVASGIIQFWPVSRNARLSPNEYCQMIGTAVLFVIGSLWFDWMFQFMFYLIHHHNVIYAFVGKLSKTRASRPCPLNISRDTEIGSKEHFAIGFEGWRSATIFEIFWVIDNFIIFLNFHPTPPFAPPWHHLSAPPPAPPPISKYPRAFFHRNKRRIGIQVFIKISIRV